jgi:hypothetical protein
LLTPVLFGAFQIGSAQIALSGLEKPSVGADQESILPWLAAIGYRDWRLILEAGGIAFVAFSAFSLRNRERVREVGS